MKPCPEYEERISEMLFGEIPENEVESIHSHMAGCDGCMNFYLSLHETLKTEGHEEFLLTEDQKTEIFTYAESLKESPRTGSPFNWSLIASVAASLVVSGVIISMSTATLGVKSDVAYQKMKEMNKVMEEVEEAKEAEPLSKNESVTYNYRKEAAPAAPANKSKYENNTVTATIGGISAGEKKDSESEPGVVITNAAQAIDLNFGAGEIQRTFSYDSNGRANNELVGTITFSDEDKNILKPESETHSFYIKDSKAAKQDVGQSQQQGQALESDKLNKLFDQSTNEDTEAIEDSAMPVDNAEPRGGRARSSSRVGDKGGTMTPEEKEAQMRRRAESLKSEMKRLKELRDQQKKETEKKAPKTVEKEQSLAEAMAQEEVEQSQVVELMKKQEETVDEVKDISVAEESLKQQVELEADNLYLRAKKLKEDGEGEAAQVALEKAIEKYNEVPNQSKRLEDKKEKARELYNGLVKPAADKRPMISATAQPMSTFSIDVDTASYQMAKQKINAGQWPESHTIRAEEFINSFDYKYEAPKSKAFKVHSEVVNSPFHRGSKIMKIGVQGKRPGGDHRAPSHFCFIVDTSGSMADENRLPMVKKVMPMIIKQMAPGDKVSIIACGLNSRLVADYSAATNIEYLNGQINSLNAVGATNLEQSLVGGYIHVLRRLKQGQYNRIVLFSDGVANLGEKNAENILKTLEGAKKQGVGITVVGMGKEEYNDNFLETLANKGDGNYVFIGNNKEARKTFEEKFAATFHTIAYNVKIQVEFDPKQVSRYRLLGYENRRLKNQDFRNDSVDAGEVGSGQSVTAVYELELTGQMSNQPLAEVRLRYRDAADNRMKEFSNRVLQKSYNVDFDKGSRATRLALIAGKFAEVLRDGGRSEGITPESLLKYLMPLASETNESEINELLQLIQKSK